MRDAFRGYYAPTDDELDRIWTDGLIVLDTNALLNLFRYTEATRGDFVLVLNALKDRLWIPYQVALEFQRRRLDVIEDQMKAFADIDAAVSSASSGILKAIQSFRLHPSIDKGATIRLLEDSMKVITDTVGQSREDYKSRVVAGGTNERIFSVITALYEGRVGEPFDTAALDALYAEGAVRYESKIPPGFEDRDKPEPNRYGDLVLWRQLLVEVSDSKRPAIFITDDGKDDWWRRVKGKTYGPRIELVDEYFEASGQRVHFYAPERFLDFAKKKLDLSVSDDSLNEVEEVSRERSLADINVLLAERAFMQDKRNEIVHTLTHEDPDHTASAARAERSDSRIVTLQDERSSLQFQIRRLNEALIDIEDDAKRSTIMNQLARLSREYGDVEERINREIERFEMFSRRHHARSNDNSRRASFDSQIREIENRIMEIDSIIDGIHQ